jgi:hypothetical protein
LVAHHKRRGFDHADATELAYLELEQLYRTAHGAFLDHYVRVKGSKLDLALEVEHQALNFYDEAMRGAGPPDVSKLRAILERTNQLLDDLGRPAAKMIDDVEPARATQAPATLETMEPTPSPARKNVSEDFAKLRTKYESVLKESSAFKDALARIERDAASGDARVRRRAARDRAELEKLMTQYSKAAELKRESAKAERRARAESRAQWLGLETDTDFARHEQDLNSIARTLENKRDALRNGGQTDLLPEVDTTILDMPVDHFIRNQGSAGLQAEWNRLNADPSLRRQLNKALDLSKDPRVGARRPDIVEFFLADGEIIVTDTTLDVESSVHQFKTRLYREILQAMVGPNGPNVYGFDVDPRARPGVPRVVVHDEPL